jgi:hypothetical protein
MWTEIKANATLRGPEQRNIPPFQLILRMPFVASNFLILSDLQLVSAALTGQNAYSYSPLHHVF